MYFAVRNLHDFINALAADSAVTLGDERKKIYNTAEKLFQLSPEVPVGIMTFGSADMMGIPWETIAKGFAQKLGNRRFDTLEEYATNFFAFVEASTALFPPPRQAEYVKRVSAWLWSEYRSRLEERIASRKVTTVVGRRKSLAEIVQSDLRAFRRDPLLENLGHKYGALVVKTYASALDEVESDVFERVGLSASNREDLRRTIQEYFSRQPWGPYVSGIVIAGMGEEEPFPAVLQYDVETIAANRLRYTKAREGRLDLDYNAMVMPFAQRETIDMIIMGIHPAIKSMMLDEAESRLAPTKRSSSAEANGFTDFRDSIDRYVSEQYEDPFMTAVSALPRQDLAKMAESLVSLTAFLMRMTANQDETVSAPIDVALLSKADGFTWVRRKDLIREAGLAL